MADSLKKIVFDSIDLVCPFSHAENHNCKENIYCTISELQKLCKKIKQENSESTHLFLPTNPSKDLILLYSAAKIDQVPLLERLVSPNDFAQFLKQFNPDWELILAARCNSFLLAQEALKLGATLGIYENIRASDYYWTSATQKYKSAYNAIEFCIIYNHFNLLQYLIVHIENLSNNATSKLLNFAVSFDRAEMFVYLINESKKLDLRRYFDITKFASLTFPHNLEMFKLVCKKCIEFDLSISFSEIDYIFELIGSDLNWTESIMTILLDKYYKNIEMWWRNIITIKTLNKLDMKIHVYFQGKFPSSNPIRRFGYNILYNSMNYKLLKYYIEQYDQYNIQGTRIENINFLD